MSGLEGVREAVEANDRLRGRAEVLRSIPDVGAVTAATLLADMSELGSFAAGHYSASPLATVTAAPTRVAATAARTAQRAAPIKLPSAFSRRIGGVSA